MSDFKLVKLLGNPITLNANVNPRGVYSNTTSYNIGDSVSYGVSSYIAITATLGNLPTNTTYWQLLAEGSNIGDIEDSVGDMFVDTSTVDFSYNTLTNEISAIVPANSITDTQVNKISLTKIEDNQNKNYESSILTTNNIVTDILSVNVTSDCSIFMEAKIIGRRTGGSSGSAGDAATFKRSFRVKCIGGVVSIHDIQSDYTSRDNATWNVSFQAVGSNVFLKVKGASNNNIQWILNLITSINI